MDRVKIVLVTVVGQEQATDQCKGADLQVVIGAGTGFQDSCNKSFEDH